MNATKLSVQNAVPVDVVAESMFPSLPHSAFSIIMQKNKDRLQKNLVVYVTKVLAKRKRASIAPESSIPLQ